MQHYYKWTGQKAELIKKNAKQTHFWISVMACGQRYCFGIVDFQALFKKFFLDGIYPPHEVSLHTQRGFNT
jgi:hypothetical protein